MDHPGSWHDSKAFHLTVVAQLMEEDLRGMLPDGIHIIGDSAYPLMNQLMEPYSDNGHLTVGPSIKLEH